MKQPLVSGNVKGTTGLLLIKTARGSTNNSESIFRLKVLYDLVLYVSGLIL